MVISKILMQMNLNTTTRTQLLFSSEQNQSVKFLYKTFFRYGNRLLAFARAGNLYSPIPWVKLQDITDTDSSQGEITFL